jgi:hydrogenase nickel incorporation protein HypA/HybF
MHELAICEALMEQVLKVAAAQQAVAVADIYVSVGPLSGVEGPLMRNAFPIAAAGTLADRARLHVEAAPVRVRCEQCGEESEATVNRLLCDHCGDWRTTLISGDELLLRRVVLDTAETAEARHV